MATVDHGNIRSKSKPESGLSGGAAVFIWIESMRRKNDIKGMSLLELVIVLAIVAILSAYVIPAYQSYIRRGHRSAVCTALYRAAQAVEQMLAERSATGERMKLPSSLNWIQEQSIVCACRPGIQTMDSTLLRLGSLKRVP